MFSRMFGRRKSPVEGEPDTDSGVEITEHPQDETCDEFVVVNETPPRQMMGDNPPPYCTLPAATAFNLPYSVRPSATERQESVDMSTQSLLKGIPFKFGTDVRIEGNMTIPELNNVASLVTKINNFDWDYYEYSFKLERDVLEEYATKLENAIVEETLVDIDDAT